VAPLPLAQLDLLDRRARVRVQGGRRRSVAQRKVDRVLAEAVQKIVDVVALASVDAIVQKTHSRSAARPREFFTPPCTLSPRPPSMPREVGLQCSCSGIMNTKRVAIICPHWKRVRKLKRETPLQMSLLLNWTTKALNCDKLSCWDSICVSWKSQGRADKPKIRQVLLTTLSCCWSDRKPIMLCTTFVLSRQSMQFVRNVPLCRFSSGSSRLRFTQQK